MRTQKRTLKYLMGLALLLGSFLLLTRCEQPGPSLPEQGQVAKTHTPTIETVGYDQFLNGIGTARLPKAFLSPKSSTAKSGDTGMVPLANGFAVYTGSIQRIDDGQTVSWTFRVAENLGVASVFENFLVKDHHGELSYFLVAYDPDGEADGDFPYSAFSYQVPVEDLNLENLNLSSKDYFDWAPPDEGGGYGECECYNVYERCDVGGNPDGHGPQLQNDGSYCSGSPLAYVDCSHCDDGSSGSQPPGGSSGGDGGDNGSGNTLPDGGGGGSDESSGGSGNTFTSPEYEDGTTAATNLKRTLGLSLTSSQQKWIDNPANAAIVGQIDLFVNSNGKSVQAKREALLTVATLASEAPWKPKSGNYLGRIPLRYKAVRTINVNGTNLSQFLLNNDDVISTGDYALCPLCNESGERTYYYSRSEALWYEYKVPPTPDIAGDLNYLMDTVVWESATFVGRYVLPVEDIIILIDGKDFDGVEQSRVQAAGWILVGLVPGTKGLKPVAKLIKGYDKFSKIVKVGNNSVRLPPTKLVGNIVDFGSEGYNRAKLREVLQLAKGNTKHAHHIIPWKFKDFDIVQKAAKSDKVFHISEALNGIALPSTNHLTGHAKYNAKVGQILVQLNSGVGSNYNLAHNKLTGFINYLDNLIRTNPDKNLGQIADVIKYPQ